MPLNAINREPPSCHPVQSNSTELLDTVYCNTSATVLVPSSCPDQCANREPDLTGLQDAFERNQPGAPILSSRPIKLDRITGYCLLQHQCNGSRPVILSRPMCKSRT